jgi:uracil-DNA glycosylase|tara:strand:+ start:177 stop:365 length:189 start_codon:yes stop_codon:yes gene_type:complete
VKAKQGRKWAVTSIASAVKHRRAIPMRTVAQAEPVPPKLEAKLAGWFLNWELGMIVPPELIP